MALLVVERYVPRMIEEVPCTAPVVTVKSTLEAPGEIVAVEGTWAADVLLLVSETTAPPGGAAPLRVNVPVEVAPPVTVPGLSVSDVSVATETVRVVVLVKPYTPEIVTDVVDATPLVVMVKEAVLAPAAIMTLAGTCAANVLLLCRVTTAPPVGAAPFRVTVPVALFPPTTDVGVRVTEESVGALIVSVVVLLTPYVPVIVAIVLTATGVVLILNVAVLAPAVIVTLACTTAADVLLCRVTTAPPKGAAPFNVAVPVEEAPPVTACGLRVSDNKVAGLTVRVAVLAVPYVPVITAEEVAATPLVVMVKVAVVVPADTVTLLGVCATPVLLLDNVTLAPPVGAGPVRVTVPVELLPPTKVVGLRVRDVRAAAGGVTVRTAFC